MPNQVTIDEANIAKPFPGFPSIGILPTGDLINIPYRYRIRTDNNSITLENI